MDKSQATKLIEETYSFTHQQFVTRVICRNDVTHYGFFYFFDDYEYLKAKNQYRFIPRNNLQSFQSEHLKNGRYDTNYSVILDGEEMLNIEFVLPLHIQRCI